MTFAQGTTGTQRVQFDLLGPAQVMGVSSLGNVQVRGLNIGRELVLYGLETRPETASFLQSELLGREVWLEFDTGQETLEEVLGYTYPFVYMYVQDPAGRWQAGDKRFRQINLLTLERGASAFTNFPPNMTYRGLFTSAAQNAESQRLGVWFVEQVTPPVEELPVFDRDNVAEIFRIARSGSPLAMRPYIKDEMSLEIINEDGDTPLLVAARFNSPAMIAFLLDSGADPGINNPNTGESVLRATRDNPNRGAILELFAARDVPLTIDTMSALDLREIVNAEIVDDITARPNLDPVERSDQLTNRAAELTALERRTDYLQTLRAGATGEGAAGADIATTSDDAGQGGAAGGSADVALPTLEDDDTGIQQVLDERQEALDGREQGLGLVRRSLGRTAPSPANMLDNTIQALPRTP
ncbi:MAG: hypothetical protein AAF267_10630 [Deinococcota bacterium]